MKWIRQTLMYDSFIFLLFEYILHIYNKDVNSDNIRRLTSKDVLKGKIENILLLLLYLFIFKAMEKVQPTSETAQAYYENENGNTRNAGIDLMNQLFGRVFIFLFFILYFYEFFFIDPK